MQTLNLKQALAFDDVTLVPKYSEIASRSDVNLATKISDKVALKIPLISTNMSSVTGVRLAIELAKLGGLGILHRFDSAEAQADKVAQVKKEGLLVGASVGIKDGFLERAEMLVNAGVDVLDIDVAHGHLKFAIEATKILKEKFPHITLISGIVATGEAAEAHYKNGADCVSVGVGGGSICTTRVVTGSGIPTFSSLMDVAPVARKYNKTFLPLAGVENSGHIVKALATGACAVRCGRLFAGTTEAESEFVVIEGKKYKKYKGSTSMAEKVSHIQNLPNEYNTSYTKHIEGVEGLVPYEGDLVNLVEGILSSVRSGLSYSGAKTISQLWENAEFVQLTQASIKEGNHHDIIVK